MLYPVTQHSKLCVRLQIFYTLQCYQQQQQQYYLLIYLFFAYVILIFPSCEEDSTFILLLLMQQLKLHETTEYVSQGQFLNNGRIGVSLHFTVHVCYYSTTRTHQPSLAWLKLKLLTFSILSSPLSQSSFSKRFIMFYFLLMPLVNLPIHLPFKLSIFLIVSSSTPLYLPTD